MEQFISPIFILKTASRERERERGRESNTEWQRLISFSVREIQMERGGEKNRQREGGEKNRRREGGEKNRRRERGEKYRWREGERNTERERLISSTEREILISSRERERAAIPFICTHSVEQCHLSRHGNWPTSELTKMLVSSNLSSDFRKPWYKFLIEQLSMGITWYSDRRRLVR